ncbi:hypothetical protein [Janthinobacterium sp. CG3]|uniref:hypothetical protein n=1 Tax=Janthinobacterium sp. CG3 TaxID=1075768 RepID=UPI00035D1DC5|nr:hypothetical protein [Janthinobacterium sp. CG3]
MALTLTFIHPALEVSVQVPVAGVSAVVLAASAALDSRSLNRTLFDGVNAVDLATIAVTKRLADIAVASNAIPVFILSKVFQDAAVSSDVVAIVAQFFRAFADVASSTDVALITSGKELADTGSASDSVTTLTGKALADVTTAADALNVSSTKAAADAATATDAVQAGVTKAINDTASAIESALLFMTDYADITYFAADYVGSSRTF